MFPTINLRETGINLHRIMDKRGITPKDIKEFLDIGSIQTVYNWCNGLNMPKMTLFFLFVCHKYSFLADR